MRKIRSLNVQNRKGAEQQQKQKVPLLKDVPDQLDSFNYYYTRDSIAGGLKYIHGLIFDDNQIYIDPDNLFIDKTETNGSEIVWGEYNEYPKTTTSPIAYLNICSEQPGFGTDFIYYIMIYYYYYDFIGDKSILISYYCLRITEWYIENAPMFIMFLKNDIPKVLSSINSISKNKIKIEEIENNETKYSFKDINTWLFNPQVKYGADRFTVDELFKLYGTFKSVYSPGEGIIQNNAWGCATFCRKDGDVDITINPTGSTGESVYLCYYNDSKIWECTSRDKVPNADFINHDKTIEIDGNTYYKVLMAKKTGQDTYYPILYLDWGEYDVDKVMSLDPKSIEPAVLTPLSYYGYLKTIADNVVGICQWADNSGSSIGSDVEQNNYGENFNSFIRNHKNSFTSDEIYKYCKLDEYLRNLTLTVCEFLLKNLEKIKTFYSKHEYDYEYEYIERITWGLISYTTDSIPYYDLAEQYPDRNFKDYYPPYYPQFLVNNSTPKTIMKDYGTITDGVFTFNNTKQDYPESYWCLYYGLYHQPRHEVSKPDNFQEYSSDMRDYSQAMKWIYSKTSDSADLLMSFDQNPEPVVNAGEGQYTEYEIKDN